MASKSISHQIDHAKAALQNTHLAQPFWDHSSPHWWWTNSFPTRHQHFHPGSVDGMSRVCTIWFCGLLFFMFSDHYIYRTCISGILVLLHQGKVGVLCKCHLKASRSSLTVSTLASPAKQSGYWHWHPSGWKYASIPLPSSHPPLPPIFGIIPTPTTIKGCWIGLRR